MNIQKRKEFQIDTQFVPLFGAKLPPSCKKGMQSQTKKQTRQPDSSRPELTCSKNELQGIPLHQE